MREFGRLVALSVALLLVFTACSDDPPAADGSTSTFTGNIPGVVFERAASRTHRKGEINYPGKHPPSGGDHNPTPLTCGFYNEQPPDEYAVHSLEHGAVWIAFDPSLDAASVTALKAFASEDHVLVTPYAGMNTPITIVAWQRRLEVSSADDPRIREFVDTFRNAKTAPEPGFACAGVGQPAS